MSQLTWTGGSPGEGVGAIIPAIPWPAVSRRAELLVAISLVLLAALVGLETGGNFNPSRLVQPPDLALRAFFSAWQRGDADRVWAEVTIPATRADASYLSPADLARTLASPLTRQLFQSAQVHSAASPTGQRAAVAAKWVSAAGTVSGSWQLQRSGLGWKVVLPPVLAVLTIPPGAAASVDGRPLALAAGSTTTIAAFPGQHAFALAASRWLAADQKAVLLAPLAPAASVAFAPEPTPEAEATALAALEQAFKACAASTAASLSGCPQLAQVSSRSFQWRLVGDPTAAVSWSFAAGQLVAAGHYQMLLGYLDPTLNGIQHVVVGGGYRAPFLLQADVLKPTGIAPAADVAALARPEAATDDAIRNAVRPAFAACAQATAMAVVDCPMRGDTTDPSIQNVSWSLDSDPLASATVSFDPTSGAFSVAGSFALHDHYRAVGLITFSHDDPVVGGFSTTVFWNDGSPVVAGIARTA